MKNKGFILLLILVLVVSAVFAQENDYAYYFRMGYIEGYNATNASATSSHIKTRQSGQQILFLVLQIRKTRLKNLPIKMGIFQEEMINVQVRRIDIYR